MTPEQLKASILQSAMQGKLVEQMNSDQNVDTILASIVEEKRNLEKKSLIKKSKKLPDISEEEIPYDAPSTWKWVRLNDIVYNHGQKTPDQIFSYIDIGSIDNMHQRLNEEETLIEPSKAPSRARKIVKLDDIIYSTVRPYLHNTCIIDKTFKAEPIASTGFAVLTCHKGLYNKYLFYYLLSPIFDSYANATENAKGVAYPAINDDRLYRAVVPLPPLEEQHRIVAKIEELLPYVDRYAEAYEKLEQFNTKFPEDMKKAILQYAIQGKLVEQRPEEGTAEELYQQIQEEKNRLIREGKIKKEKPLVEISDDEIPFDIPETWKWVRISQASLAIVDCPHSTPKYYDSETEYCAIDTNCINENGEITGFRYVDEEAYSKRIERLEPNENDIVYTREGSIGRAAILPPNKKICLGQRVMLIRCTEHLNVDYLKKILMAPQTISTLTAKQRGLGAKHVNVVDVCNLIIPLPPFEEQHRIVAKIEELLPYCERLIG